MHGYAMLGISVKSIHIHIEKVRVQNLLHITSRVVCKVLAHTVAVLLKRQLGRAPLSFEGLITMSKWHIVRDSSFLLRDAAARRLEPMSDVLRRS